MDRDDRSVAGIGLYTASEVAALLKVRPQKLRRWLSGYHVAGRSYEPLWTPQLPMLDKQLGIGFLDLMQLRVVSAILEKTTISLQGLRKALLRAQDLLDHTHPFATTKLKTDGRNIFLEISKHASETELYDVFSSQYVFHSIVAPSFKDVDLDSEVITQWWPLGRKMSVVLDPKRSFGEPIGYASGLPTATLSLAVERTGSEQSAIRWYPSATTKEVRDAVAFERRLATSRSRNIAA